MARWLFITTADWQMCSPEPLRHCGWYDGRGGAGIALDVTGGPPSGENLDVDFINAAENGVERFLMAPLPERTATGMAAVAPVRLPRAGLAVSSATEAAVRLMSRSSSSNSSRRMP